MQISLQFDEFFNKNFKILISLGFEVFTINKTCWDTQYDENSNIFSSFSDSRFDIFTKTTRLKLVGGHPVSSAVITQALEAKVNDDYIKN